MNCPIGKNSGRTKWMLDQLMGDVVSGSPDNIVVAHDSNHAKQLISLYLDNCVSLGLKCVRYENLVLVNEYQKVEFMSLNSFEKLCYYPSWTNVYIDHYALGEE